MNSRTQFYDQLGRVGVKEMPQELIFQENVLDIPGEYEPAGQENDGSDFLPKGIEPGTVALIVGALLAGELSQTGLAPEGLASARLWKRMGRLELMMGRQNLRWSGAW